MWTRPLVALIALIALTTSAAAQGPGKVHRVGFLFAGASAAPAARAAIEGLTRALAERGYVAGGNLVVESRFAEGQTKRLPELAKELADDGCEVIITTGYKAAHAAKDAAGMVPIVATSAGDPVQTGLAASLSRPGGDLTGISDMAAELSAKRLDLLKQAVPGLRRVAMLWNAGDLGMTTRYQAATAVAAKLGIAVEPLGVREPDDFNSAFDAMTHQRPDGILMVTDALTILNRKRVFDFAAAHRIPAIYEFDFLARDGGLMSYGPDGKEATAQIADLVDRILKGAKPADLPFEQPTLFRFVINKKTADSIGLVIPQGLLARADEVIE